MHRKVRISKEANQAGATVQDWRTLFSALPHIRLRPEQIANRLKP
jgi:hypothetical protein